MGLFSPPRFPAFRVDRGTPGAGAIPAGEPSHHNLMVLAVRLIEQVGLEGMGGLLTMAPGIGEIFAGGLDAGIRALQRLANDHPILAWNAMIIRAEQGTLGVDEVHRTLELVERGLDVGMFSDCLLLKPKLDYLREPEEGQIYFGMLQHRLVSNHGRPEETLEIYREYLRWHGLRWLHAQGDRVAGDWLPVLLSSWPADSVLQLEDARRRRDRHPEDAGIARAYREVLRLDPSCEEAIQALAGRTKDVGDPPLAGRPPARPGRFPGSPLSVFSPA